MNCPDCKRRLTPLQTSCKCGWKDRALSDLGGFPCAHVGCGLNAICSVKTPTGRANLCKAHYASHWTVDVIKAIPTGKPSTQHMEEVRKAYLKSYAYRHRDDYAIVPQKPDNEERMAA